MPHLALTDSSSIMPTQLAGSESICTVGQDVQIPPWAKVSYRSYPGSVCIFEQHGHTERYQVTADSQTQIVITDSVEEAAAAAAVVQEIKQQQQEKKQREQEKRMREQEKRMRDAAQKGDAAGVRACLEAGADPNAPDPDCWGMDSDEEDADGMTAMHLAALGGKSVEVLEVLHGAGAEVDKVDQGGVTPLMAAAGSDATGAVVRWLLEQGADWRLQATSGPGAGGGPPG
eukprot:COSAG06_NODE_12933_length_1310_cov_30.715111_2_plen_229_part_01